LNFSWNLGKGLYVAAGLGFVAPTGSTYAGSLVPDYWTIRPHAAVSYLGEGWNLTVSALYDINTASQGNTGLYQVIARNAATAPAVAALFSGPTSPARGYTSGNDLYGPRPKVQ
jgi:Putative MetA-pathway of phenol degradation